MTRVAFTVAEAKEQLDGMIQRRIETRRGLVQAAIEAAAPFGLQLAEEIQAGRRPSWPELAPLTKAEKAAVYCAISAGAAPADGGSPNVD